MVVNNNFVVHRIDLFAPIESCPMLWIVPRPFDLNQHLIYQANASLEFGIPCHGITFSFARDH
jgi:hypothetical protein